MRVSRVENIDSGRMDQGRPEPCMSLAMAATLWAAGRGQRTGHLKICMIISYHVCPGRTVMGMVTKTQCRKLQATWYCCRGMGWGWSPMGVGGDGRRDGLDWLT